MKRRRSLLIEEPPMQVLPSLAAAIGLEEALFLQQLHYWLQGPNRRQHLGYQWIYNTYEEWLEQFPFWTYQTLQRTVTSLEEMRLIIAKPLDKAKWERRKWYTVDYEAVDLLSERIDEVITSLRETRSRAKEHAGRTTTEHIKLIHSIVSISQASNISNWYVQEDQVDTLLKEQETTSIDYSKREAHTQPATAAATPPAKVNGYRQEPAAPDTDNQRSRKTTKAPAKDTVLAELTEAGRGAVEHYRTAFGKYPTAIGMREIGQRVHDLDRWAGILKQWNLKGWNPGNIGGMVDAYEKGATRDQQTPIPASAAPTEEEYLSRRAAAPAPLRATLKDLARTT
jgi:ribosomal protein L12E/L44/L45/RPP1/RPP2